MPTKKKATPKPKEEKLKEKWVGGLSDCCDAPLKEIGEGLTILTCSECGDICNKKFDEEDFFDDQD